ncbi:hypothetical protein WR25_04392 isoform E [Diploscapter pachys]|uniref:Uncharacterized protein n=1 Tax=Diploscapter pachys TaxID=2018661 RepID=A0A2A2JWB4_9BILA|nr:hypothetical protein WR25_04392 isoform E [Diploscapter pachys]
MEDTGLRELLLQVLPLVCSSIIGSIFDLSRKFGNAIYWTRRMQNSMSKVRLFLFEIREPAISVREQQKSDGGNVKLVGKMMNTSDFAKRQTVHFNDTPKTDSIKSTTKGAGNEKNGEGAGSDESDGSEKESEEETLMQRDKDSDSDEYEMPPMNNRYVKKKTMKVPAPSMDCPEDNLKANEEHERDIVAKIGELHGKLATARLRSQARKLEQSMTQEEREEVKLN